MMKSRKFCGTCGLGLTDCIKINIARARVRKQILVLSQNSDFSLNVGESCLQNITTYEQRS